MKKLAAVVLVCAVVAGWALARNVDTAAPTKVASLVYWDEDASDYSKAFLHFNMPEITLAEGESIASAILMIECETTIGSAVSVQAHTITETAWSYNATPVATFDGYALGNVLDTESVSAVAGYQFDITGNASQGFIKLFTDGATAFSVVLVDAAENNTPNNTVGVATLGAAEVPLVTDTYKNFRVSNAYIRIVVSESSVVVPEDTLAEDAGTKEIPRQSFATGGSFGF